MLFDKQITRKPNLYPWADEFINKFWTTFWTPNEFDFRSDVNQFKVDLTSEESIIFSRALAFIGQIEVNVKTFWGDLGKNLPHPSMYDLGYVMANSEVVHNFAYEKLLTKLGLENLFEEILKEPVALNRVTYLKKYNEKNFADNKKQYIYSIILFTLFVENASLFSQFYTILHFNKYRNLFKDTAQQVQYTIVEEQLHTQVGIRIINTLREEYPELFDEELDSKIQEELHEAYRSECAVIDWIIGDYSDGSLSAAHLKNYVANRLNHAMISIGMSPTLDIDPDILKDTVWMDEEVIGSNVTDFFHKKPTAYAKHAKSFNIEDIF